jgi:hypothetical protein
MYKNTVDIIEKLIDTNDTAVNDVVNELVSLIQVNIKDDDAFKKYINELVLPSIFKENAPTVSEETVKATLTELPKVNYTIEKKLKIQPEIKRKSNIINQAKEKEEEETETGRRIAERQRIIDEKAKQGNTSSFLSNLFKPTKTDGKPDGKDKSKKTDNDEEADRKDDIKKDGDNSPQTLHVNEDIVIKDFNPDEFFDIDVKESSDLQQSLSQSSSSSSLSTLLEQKLSTIPPIILPEGLITDNKDLFISNKSVDVDKQKFSKIKLFKNPSSPPSSSSSSPPSSSSSSPPPSPSSLSTLLEQRLSIIPPIILPEGLIKNNNDLFITNNSVDKQKFSEIDLFKNPETIGGGFNKINDFDEIYDKVKDLKIIKKINNKELIYLLLNTHSLSSLITKNKSEKILNQYVNSILLTIIEKLKKTIKIFINHDVLLSSYFDLREIIFYNLINYLYPYYGYIIDYKIL